MDQRIGSGRARREAPARHNQAARRVVAEIVKAGAKAYDRARDLPALVRTDPFAKAPDSAEEIADVVARLERALRAERKRARSGHWTYDLNRHIALKQAYAAESERLAAMTMQRRQQPDGCGSGRA